MPQFLTRTEAAQHLAARGLPRSPQTLSKYACTGGGPQFRRFGRQVRYEPAALDAWADKHLSPPMSSTSEVAG